MAMRSVMVFTLTQLDQISIAQTFTYKHEYDLQLQADITFIATELWHFMFAFSIRRSVNPVSVHSVLHPQSLKNVGPEQSNRKIANWQKCKPFIHAMQFGLLFPVLSSRYEASHQDSAIEHLYSIEKI